MELAPIVLFVYNRIEYLELTLSSLRDNLLANESTLIVYCDGPKPNASRNELDSINKVRTLVKSQGWPKKLKVYESDSNLGLSNSIISGVTEVLNEYNKAIIIEDDLVLSIHFLQYMNEALSLYKDTPEVFSICGHNYGFNVDSLNETFFLNITSTLGWGTWQRAWQHFEKDPNVLISKIKEKRLQYAFDLDNSYPYMKMLRRTALGKVNSWGIRWYATVFLLDKLSLIPKISLVKHIGVDGTNFNSSHDYLFAHPISNTKINYFEKNIARNYTARKELIIFQKTNRLKKYGLKNLVSYLLTKVKFNSKF